MTNRLPDVLGRRGMSWGRLARRTLLPARLVARPRAPHANPRLAVAERVAARARRAGRGRLALCPRVTRNALRGSSPRAAGPTVALAARAGLDRAHVNQLKNGRALPTVATALAIARALGVPVAVVFPPGASDRRRGGAATSCRRSSARSSAGGAVPPPRTM